MSGHCEAVKARRRRARKAAKRIIQRALRSGRDPAVYVDEFPTEREARDVMTAVRNYARRMPWPTTL